MMLLYVYAAVIALCFVTFRSWRAVVVAVVPLAVTSILCEALMVGLGIGVKVATLPVIALGVGIGVDYALYLLSVQLAQQRAGVPLAAGVQARGPVHRQGRRARRHHAGGRRHHLGMVADQVPGRHGDPADVHVHLEHAGRADPDSRALVLPAADGAEACAGRAARDGDMTATATAYRMATLDRFVGSELGVSPWVDVDQRRIDAFAECTGDRQWIHVDSERAQRESPFGGTIAHGFLTLSLAATLAMEAGVIPPDAGAALNYGLGKVRFLAPVKAGARVRNRVALLAIEPKDEGRVLITFGNTIEIEGEPKPALVAELMAMLIAAPAA